MHCIDSGFSIFNVGCFKFMILVVRWDTVEHEGCHVHCNAPTLVSVKLSQNLTICDTKFIVYT